MKYFINQSIFTVAMLFLFACNSTNKRSGATYETIFVSGSTNN